MRLFTPRASILRSFLCWAMAVVLPHSIAGQSTPDQSASAILHTDGGVWVNGYEAHDSSAIFPGDLVETKPNASANLVLDGSTVLLAPETVGKFQGDSFELDHGVVSVVTSKSFKVRVNCILIVPALSQWTQYVVSDLNGSVQVSAKKLDVNVQREQAAGKTTVEGEASQSAVHEGEQKTFDESEICGTRPQPSSPASGISPKWIAVGGGGGAGLLICLVLHCFGSSPTKPSVSPANP